MRTIRNGLLVAAATAALSLVATPANALALYQDTHDGTLPRNAFGSGTSIDCTTAELGCSLKVDPAGLSAYAGVRAEMNTFLGHTTVRFAFKNDDNSANVDADVMVRMNDGGVVKLHLTDGWAYPNNGLTLVTPAGVISNFDTTPSTWASYYVDVDGDTGNVTAGRVGGVPARLALGSGYNALESVEFTAIRWGSGAAVRYDNTLVVQG